MVLAIGIVVDDAIVVVENIERLMEEKGLTPREAAHKTMDEVSGALIAIALVLCGVFIPTAFIPGISGQFYKQFALTIVSATAISAFVSLTLSPSLAALLLKPSREHGEPRAGWRGAAGQRFAQRLQSGFRPAVRRVMAASPAAAVRALALVGICLCRPDPVGRLALQRDADRLHPRAGPGLSDRACADAAGRLAAADHRRHAPRRQDRARPTRRLQSTVAFAGLDGATFSTAPNAGAMFVPLKAKRRPRQRRRDRRRAAQGVRPDQRPATSSSSRRRPVRGIGTGGGWKMMIEDRTGAGYQALEGAAFGMMMAGQPGRGHHQSPSPPSTPARRACLPISTARSAEQLGVPVQNIFSTLGTYLGSTYINDFNFLGRTYRVTAQADAPYRDQISDVGNCADALGHRRDGAAGRGADDEERQRAVPRRALQSLSLGRASGRYGARLFVGPVADDDGEARRRRSCPRA